MRGRGADARHPFPNGLRGTREPLRLGAVPPGPEHPADQDRCHNRAQEAEAEVARIRTEAEAKQREETARLERERNTLEARITELRNFERDYRSQLRGYIEGQLRELDEKSASTDSTPVSAIGL